MQIYGDAPEHPVHPSRPHVAHAVVKVLRRPHPLACLVGARVVQDDAHVELGDLLRHELLDWREGHRLWDPSDERCREAHAATELAGHPVGLGQEGHHLCMRMPSHSSRGVPRAVAAVAAGRERPSNAGGDGRRAPPPRPPLGGRAPS